jgi:hypothetical protein
MILRVCHRLRAKRQLWGRPSGDSNLPTDFSNRRHKMTGCCTLLQAPEFGLIGWPLWMLIEDRFDRHVCCSSPAMQPTFSGFEEGRQSCETLFEAMAPCPSTSIVRETRVARCHAVSPLPCPACCIAMHIPGRSTSYLLRDTCCLVYFSRQRQARRDIWGQHRATQRQWERS